MSAPTVTGLFSLENTFARDLEGLYVPWQGDHVPDPSVVLVNESLAADLGLDPERLRSVDGAAVLSGSVAPEGATPIAMAYSGHQFGNFSPVLGDGRALLLGEMVGPDGRRRDVHLKGSGRTPFARGGDGKAVLGPMLREYLISEAMHALGIPTTRSLAVTTTGESVQRDGPEPGAVLTRIASSHIRVGMFEFAVRRGDLVRRLAEYTIARHHPDLVAVGDVAERHLVFFERVLDAQASLVARWMAVGFVHGVLNTDNTTISGETIDYGPCAFIDAHDPATVFSSIDTMGRYAFGNQPAIIGWNLARFAETLIPMVGARADGTVDADAAIARLTEVLSTFGDRFDRCRGREFAAKLGFGDADLPADLLADLDTLLREERVDHTLFFRELAHSLRTGESSIAAAQPWIDRWTTTLGDRAATPDAATRTAEAMDRVNPVVIPRNHHVDNALRAAESGDLDPFHRLLGAVTHPFEAGDPVYAAPAPDDFAAGFQTFCGT